MSYTASTPTSPARGILRFTYTTTSMSGSVFPASGCLLMMGLPHHKSLLLTSLTTEATSLGWPVVLTRISIRGIRGPTTGVLGSSWTLVYDLSEIGWSSPRGVKDLNKARVIAETLLADQGYKAPSGDPYFGGAEVSHCSSCIQPGGAGCLYGCISICVQRSTLGC